MLDWFIANKEILKLIYAFIIVFICFIIVIRTHRLFKLSLHQGIRYFRNAFLFYGLGFFVRYILGTPYLGKWLRIDALISGGIFAFFLMMAGFFLLYSLIWRKIESENKTHLSSLINGKILIFYLMAIVLIVLGGLWETHYFIFLSQIFVFSFAVIISFNNYIQNGTKGKFLKYYFVAMLLSLVAWALNFLVALYFNWDQAILSGIYIINLIIFFLFLFGVVRVARVK